MNDIKKIFYYVETWNRDGEHEYTDRFCITAPDLDTFFAPHDDAEDLIDQTILNWNYGICEWDDGAKTYTDGGWRHIRVDRVDRIPDDESFNVLRTGNYLTVCNLESHFEEKLKSLTAKQKVAL
jgi:hypothetical protein